MMQRTWMFLFLLLSLNFFSPAFAVGIEEDLTESQKVLFREVSKDLRCPTCTGLSILESDASFSLQMKSVVHDQVKQGQSKDQILKFFTERYGIWILREPPKQGFHILAWLLPLGTMILGPLLIWLFVWRKRQTLSSHGIRPNSEIIDELDALIANEKGKV